MSWLQVVLLATGQDGATLTPDVATTEVEAHCQAGVEAACLEGWVPFDREVLAEALPEHCERGDPVACLFMGWHLSQPDWGSFSDDPMAPPDAVRLFQKTCDLGLPRGCTDVANTYAFGHGTYPSGKKAQALVEPLCADGDPLACRLAAYLAPRSRRVELMERARELGEPLAAKILADWSSDPAEQRALRKEACDNGARTACILLADAVHTTDVAHTTELLHRGCALGDHEVCAQSVLWRAKQKDIGTAAATTALFQLCDEEPDDEFACVSARLVERGAPPTAFQSGRFPQVADTTWLKNELKPAIHQCYVDWLRAGGRFEGDLELDILVAEDGTLLGAATGADWPDTMLHDCLFDAAINQRTSRPLVGGSLGLQLTYGLSHAAGVKFKPKRGLDAPKDVTVVVHASRTWGPALDACALRVDTPVSGIELALKVSRSGAVKTTVANQSESELVDTCVVEAVETMRTERILGPVRGTLSVDFFEPAAPVRAAAPIQVVTNAPWTDAPVPWRVLAVVVHETEVDGKKGALSSASVASIREAHEAAADWVHEYTAGQVEMQVDVLSLDVPLRGALEDGGDELGGPPSKWSVEPDDVPLELLAEIEPLKYHSIYLWAAVPNGYPRPALGTAWSHTSLRGATFASSVLLHRGKVTANSILPPFYLVLHELWHQLEYRAGQHLGVRIPDNHEIARLPDGTVLNPRTWHGGQDAAEWYAWAYTQQMHPDLWTDLLTWGQDRNRVVEGNLAYTAVPFSSGDIAGTHQLNDGVLDFGRFLDSARRIGEPDPDGTYFGVRLSEPRAVTRVRAHVGEPPDGASTLGALAVEVLVSGERWQEVARLDEVASIAEVTFDAFTTQAVRIRVLETVDDEVQPACWELEVF